ncbi:hypothetical protein ACJ41O_011951 [Fusarium nematophilum]
MPPRKRTVRESDAADEVVPKRRSLRQAASKDRQRDAPAAAKEESEDEQVKKPRAKPKAKKVAKTRPSKKEKAPQKADDPPKGEEASRALSEDPDVDSIPTTNPDAPKHDGQWYWLMKAEPESRIVNGVDVKFSIDDLRDKDEPEGWDGIRNYGARNNMRNMNAGDLAFFYASSCAEPGIMGIMEIVKEFSEDRSARRPGAPYYDPASTKSKPRWDLVHVEFRKKFAVPIHLKEIRELGKPGQPLENMQLLKQGRLSVNKVSAEEWRFLCELADKKAAEAGLEHQGPKK